VRCLDEDIECVEGHEYHEAFSELDDVITEIGIGEADENR